MEFVENNSPTIFSIKKVYQRFFYKKFTNYFFLQFYFFIYFLKNFPFKIVIFFGLKLKFPNPPYPPQKKRQHLLTAKY